jgi:hypothetical protein
VLGLGVARALAVLGAISAAHHGRAIFWANHASRGPLDGVREVYVGIVQKRKKNLTTRNWG